MSNSNSSKNALTHGLYSTNVVLPWENQQEFDDLLRAYHDEYCPDGVSEEAAVFDLASLQWKKRRLEAGLQQALKEQRDFDAKIADWDVGAAAKSQSSAVQIGCKLIEKHLLQFYQPDEAKANRQAVGSQAVEDQEKDDAQAVGSQVVDDEEKANSQAADFDRLMALMKELSIVSSGFVVPTLQAAEKLKLDQIERACQPHIMEKDMKIQADFDRRIEKVLKRLVMAKEYKRLYGAKSVRANQTEATKLPANPSHESGGS